MTLSFYEEDNYVKCMTSCAWLTKLTRKYVSNNTSYSIRFSSINIKSYP